MTEQLKPAIVRICTTNKKFVGVGVLVSHKHILTCAHVAAVASGGSKRDQVQPTNPVQLDFPYASPGKFLSAKVVFWRPAQLDWSVMPEMGADIAVLELDEPLPLKTKPIQLQLVSARELVGHPFEAFGVPAGHPQGVFADGILRHELGNRWIQIQTKDGFQIEPGFSGSPVWDKQLNTVVGITVATDPNRPEVKVGFIIPTQVLFKAWSENEIIYQRIARYSAPYIDYTKLADLLKEGKWKEADRETITIMLNVVGRTDYLDGKSIEKFPCIDLLIIDKLWMKYSEGRFGFSVHKCIWESLKHPDLEDQCRDFGNQVGWRKKKEWLMEMDELTFNSSAPKGHLPWIIEVLMDTNNKFKRKAEYRIRTKRIGEELRAFFSRVDACNL